ncbi:hypothetical protein OS493_017201 [Desmophyllum pertusum]|uniref:G-protein coupled receptors family 1 profile domain-containing protein n=1 Tax=Desmophyllum pertusum TaxID=174260 RepID=A0A9X0CGT4_9CNID|nr:hypothetical protein OS493_017201 [Desmophyllum pertusum]
MEADNTTTWNLTNNTNGTRPGSSGWFPRQMTTEDIVFDVSFCILALLIVFDNSLVIGVVIAISCGAWILATLAGTTMEFLDEKNKKLYGVIVTAIFFFIPLIIILVAYGKIFQIARAHARGRGNSSFRKDLRIATTVAVVIGLFVICWTPFFAITFAFSVRLTEYDKNAHGLHGRVRQVPNVHLQCEASFENLQQRSVTPSPQPPSGLFDMRRKSYCEGIQSESNNPIKLEILTTKSLADGLQALNEDHTNHTLPSYVPSASSLLTSTSAVAASSEELCNPVFEHDQTETGIYAIDQAIPSEKDSDMIGSKTVCKNVLS